MNLALLTRKLGPLPVWVYLAFASAATVVYVRSRKASSTPDATDTAASAGTSPDLLPGDQGAQDAAASGISPLDLAALLQGEISPLTQLLQAVYGGHSTAAQGESQGAAALPENNAQASPFDTSTSSTPGSSRVSGAAVTNPISGAAVNPISGLGPGPVAEGGGSFVPTSGISSSSTPNPSTPQLAHGLVLTG